MTKVSHHHFFHDILSDASDCIHWWTTYKWLPAWIRSLLAHLGEAIDLSIGAYTLAQLREMYREAQEYDQRQLRKAAYIGLTSTVTSKEAKTKHSHHAANYAQAAAAY